MLLDQTALSPQATGAALNSALQHQWVSLEYLKVAEAKRGPVRSMVPP